MKDCLFCNIVKGSVPCEKIFESKDVLGFKDISPMAADHFLFISKNHTDNISNLISADPGALLDIYKAIDQFTKESNLRDKGYRVVTNLGADGGQTIFHTHFHVLGGEQLKSFGA